MARITVLFAAALVAACAGAPADKSILAKNDVIDDYIKVAQLPDVDRIRYFGQLEHKLMTKKYIIIDAGNDSYLVTYVSGCYGLEDHSLIKPDIRYEANVLRARSDTYRGCRIQSMHAIDPGQRQELLSLVDDAKEQINQVQEESQ